jgi:hypothetical protein
MENNEGYCAHGLASSWPSCLGWLGLGWQPTVKNIGGKGAIARNGTGSIRRRVGGQGVGMGCKSTRKEWGTDLRRRRNRWGLTRRCPWQWSRAAGSQHRQAGGEGKVLTGLVGEVPGVALVLAVDEMELDSAGGSLSLVKQICGSSTLWCLLTTQDEDSACSDEV